MHGVHFYRNESVEQDCTHHEPAVLFQLERRRCEKHDTAHERNTISNDNDHRGEGDKPIHFALGLRINIFFKLYSAGLENVVADQCANIDSSKPHNASNNKYK
jgi:hypothetical protein